MHQGQFAGHLGRDADLRKTPSGHDVLNFSVGVNTGFGEEKKTLWVGCALWGERGVKLAQYMTKGTALSVCGALGIRQYEANGEHRAEITLNVREVTLQGGGERRADTAQRAASPAAQAQPADAATAKADAEFDDDIPF